MSLSNSRKLAHYIRSHGHPCRVLSDGSLRVACLGVVVATGKALWSVEELPARLGAVRDWLGY